MRTVFYNRLAAAAYAAAEPEIRTADINQNDIYPSELIYLSNLGYRAILADGKLIGMEVHGND